MNVWTKAEIRKARKLWNSGNMSAREIGLLFNRTKSSVIGIAHRHGFIVKGNTSLTPLTEEEKKARLEEQERKRIRKLAKEAKRMELAQKALDRLKEIEEELKRYENIEISGNIGKEELNDPAFVKQCRFVIGDPRNMRYCGLQIKNGAYCTHHYKVCHVSK